nr:hypothetical protein [Pimelobacter simplex]
MPGGDAGDQQLVDHRDDVEPRRERAGVRDEGEVEVAVGERGDEVRRAPLARGDRDAGVRRAEGGEAGQVAGDRAADDGPDPDLPADHAGQVVGDRPDPADRVERRRGVRQQRDAVRGQRGQPGAALEQPDAELALQLGDLRRDAGLAHVQRLGGAGERAPAVDLEDVAQLVQLHKH